MKSAAAKKKLSPNEHLAAVQVHMHKEQYEEALPHLLELDKIAPGNVDVMKLLIQTYDGLNRFYESAAIYKKLKKATPFPDAHFYQCMMNAMNKAGEFELTHQLYEEAKIKGLDHEYFYLYVGIAHEYIGNFSAAKEAYYKGAELYPNHEDYIRGCGLLGLKIDNQIDVLKNFNLDILYTRKAKFPFPRWQGESLEGKSIYIWKEQGIGDIIMFAGFLPLLLKQNVNVTLAMPENLISIFQRSFPSIKVVRSSSEDHEQMIKDKIIYNYQAPIGDLISYCLKDYKPRELKGYILPDPERVAKAKAKYTALGPGKLVGVSWHTINYHTTAMRNIPLKEWTPLLRTKGCHFISLQYGYRDEELEAYLRSSGMKIHNIIECDPMTEREDYFAYIAALDHVISIQNSTVHIAGSMGIDTLLMLSKTGEYRWRTEGSDNWWYPSVTIARQRKYREWKPVIEDAIEWLKQRL